MENMKYTIRPMNIGDYPRAYRLWTGGAGMGLRSLDDSEAGIRQFLERNPRTCFVAEGAPEGGGELAGVILAGHDGRRGYIYHVLVREEDRGRGLGRALVAAAEEALRGEGIHKAALVAFKTNEGGNRFWEQRGYAERTDLVYRNRSLNPENR
jgi:ribosomal protein S18 acetylase RimI-like enzyme